MVKRRYQRRRQQQRLIQYFWISGLLTGSLIISLWGILAFVHTSSSSTPDTGQRVSPSLPGMLAPDLNLPTVRGGTFHLSAQQDHSTVLTFVNTQPDTLNTPSRSQVVSLLSMQQQYGSKGTETVLIDSSSLIGQQSPTQESLLNVSYDWNLGVIPLLVDGSSTTAANRYSVHE